jgi:hypothetical protein
MRRGNICSASSVFGGSAWGGEKNQDHGTHRHCFIEFTVSFEETVNSLSLHHQSQKKAAGFLLK